MRKIGLTTLALLVGCAGGAAFREVVFPAQAASGVPKYHYKILDESDVYKAEQARGEVSGDTRQVIEDAVNRYGRAGWRFIGESGGSGGSPTWMIFETPVEHEHELQPPPQAPTATPAQ